MWGAYWGNGLDARPGLSVTGFVDNNIGGGSGESSGGGSILGAGYMC